MRLARNCPASLQYKPETLKPHGPSNPDSGLLVCWMEFQDPGVYREGRGNGDFLIESVIPLPLLVLVHRGEQWDGMFIDVSVWVTSVYVLPSSLLSCFSHPPRASPLRPCFIHRCFIVDHHHMHICDPACSPSSVLYRFSCVASHRPYVNQRVCEA